MHFIAMKKLKKRSSSIGSIHEYFKDSELQQLKGMEGSKI